MRTIIWKLAALLLCSPLGYSQTANYRAGAGNSAGEAVGSQTNAPLAFYAVVDLGTEIRLADLNNKGVIVGNKYSENSAWKWENGNWTVIDGCSYIRSFNDKGNYIGFSGMINGSTIYPHLSPEIDPNNNSIATFSTISSDDRLGGTANFWWNLPDGGIYPGSADWHETFFDSTGLATDGGGTTYSWMKSAGFDVGYGWVNKINKFGTTLISRQADNPGAMGGANGYFVGSAEVCRETITPLGEWIITGGFYPVDINDNDTVIGSKDGHLIWRQASDGTNGGNDFDLGVGQPIAINGGTDIQIIGKTAYTLPTIWLKSPVTGTYRSQLIQSCLPSNGNWRIDSVSRINDAGVIIGNATYSGTDANISSGTHAVLLLPVQITIKKKGDAEPPTDGVIVKKGDILVFALAPQYFDQEKQFESSITWKQQQLKGDGSYTSWTDIGADAKGTKFEYTTTTSGIFRFKAVIANGGENEYIRKKDAPYGANKDGVFNEKLRKGQPDFVGITDNDTQINVRKSAVSLLGRTDYAKAVSITVGYGVDSTLTFAGSWKCNIFVFRMGNAAGATVPTKIWRDYVIGIPPYVDRPVPPGANDWYNSGYSIPNWTWLGASTLPQPGYAVIHQHADVAIGGAAHMGILDYDGTWINAGKNNVNKAIHVSDSGYQPSNFRKP